MAKVLIDIPDIPKNDHQRWVLTHGGIVLDGLTNGEVMRKIHPNSLVEIGFNNKYGKVWFHIDDNCYVFDLDWWNRKWGE